MFDVDLKRGEGEVKQVSLLLYSETRSKAGYQVRLVPQRWREKHITFANAPAASRQVRAVRAAASNSPGRPSTSHPSSPTTTKYVGFVLTTLSPKGVEFREPRNQGARPSASRRT